MLDRFEGLLTLLMISGNWGHTGIFAMTLDGDGPEYFNVDPKDLDIAEYIEGAKHLTDCGFRVEAVQGDAVFCGYRLAPDWWKNRKAFRRDGTKAREE